MESTQRSPGLRTRTRGARLGRTSNLFGAGVNLGPLRPPPAAARAGQIRRPLFSTLRLSCALPFRLRLLRSSHHVGPDAPSGQSGKGRALALRNCSNEPNGAPTKAQRQRVLWGEDEQGNAARNAHLWAFRVECTLRGRCRGRPMWRPAECRARRKHPLIRPYKLLHAILHPCIQNKGGYFHAYSPGGIGTCIPQSFLWRL